MSVGFGKNLYGKQVQNVERTYDEFVVGKGVCTQNTLVSAQARGCDCGKGVLKRGVGLTPFLMDEAVVNLSSGSSVKLFLATEEENGEKEEKLGYIAKNGNAYLFDKETGVFKSIGVLSNGASVGAVDKEGAHVAIFVCDLGIYRLSQGHLAYVKDISCQAVACFCGGRVFAVSEDFFLCYSAPYEPSDFTESVEGGGKLFLRDDCGKIVGLVPLKNKLCVLFEYGISMIEVSGGARSFVRKDVCYGGDKILLGSACVGNVGGERAYFLTRSGVCRFDGVKVEKTGENLTVESAEEDCTCAFAFGQYFVAYTDKGNKKRTIVIDAESGKGYETATVNGLFGNNTTAIGVCGNTVYTLAKDGVLPSGQEAVFAVQTDFGVQGVKTVRKMRFAGEGTFTITLANGQKSWRREIQFVDGRAEVRLVMRGENFALSIQPKGGCEISELRVSIQTLSGVK